MPPAGTPMTAGIRVAATTAVTPATRSILHLIIPLAMHHRGDDRSPEEE